jgi:hypothetical protein
MIKKRSLADRINSLPKWARDYIMNIETEADPAGPQRRLIEQQDLIRELTAKIADLKGERFRPSEFEINGRAPGRPSKMRRRNVND